MRVIAVAAAVLLLAACAGTGGPTASLSSPSPAASPVASPASTATPSATPSSSAQPTPSPIPPAVPDVSCLAGVIPSNQALVSGSNAAILYDVADPIHPHAVCRIANTRAHIVTGTSFEYLVPHADGTTDVVLHALGSNNESVAATFQADLYHAYGGSYGLVAWSPGLGELAYLANGGTDAIGSVTDVWLATPAGRTRIYSYSVPGKDTFGRPGFPPETLGLSADGAYLAAGWSVAIKPVQVFRVSDRANVTPPLPADFRFGLWSKSGATLYLVTGTGVAEWTPGGGVNALPSTTAWLLGPNYSPDGTQVAFTGVSSSRDVTAYVYDLKARSSRTVSAQPRSSVMFVKSGWVWEAEERPCVQASNTACFDPTQPDGNVLAVDLSTGRESSVSFAAGESATSVGLTPGDLWPVG